MKQIATTIHSHHYKEGQETADHLTLDGLYMHVASEGAMVDLISLAALGVDRELPDQAYGFEVALTPGEARRVAEQLMQAAWILESRRTAIAGEGPDSTS